MAADRVAELEQVLTQVYYHLIGDAFALPKHALRAEVCRALRIPDLIGATLAEQGIDERAPAAWPGEDG